MALITNTTADQLLSYRPFPEIGAHYTLSIVRTTDLHRLHTFEGDRVELSPLEMKLLNRAAYEGNLPTKALAKRMKRDKSIDRSELGDTLLNPLVSYWVRTGDGTHRVTKNQFSYLLYLSIDGAVSSDELRIAVHQDPRLNRHTINGTISRIRKETGIDIQCRQGRYHPGESVFYVGEPSQYRKEYRISLKVKGHTLSANTFTGSVILDDTPRGVLQMREMQVFKAILEAGAAGISIGTLFDAVWGAHGATDAQEQNVKVQKTHIKRKLGRDFIIQRNHRLYFQIP